MIFIKRLLKKLKLQEALCISDLDAPQTTQLHAEIIQKKPFLRKLYIDFYKDIRTHLQEHLQDKYIVELGSGGGFIKEIIPDVVTSDILKLTNVDMVFSATSMPFEDQTINAFIMIDVLHHINDSRIFFKEISRCLKVGGKVVMIEPANTLWSRFIYKNFHHEPFNPSGAWGFKGEGALTAANGAIPWIVFFRDRPQFEKEFSELAINNLTVHTPLRYLLSGGLTIKQLLPTSLYTTIMLVEKILSPLNRYVGMFLTIELEKKDSISGARRTK